jgi:hypothetical protein
MQNRILVSEVVCERGWHRALLPPTIVALSSEIRSHLSPPTDDFTTINGLSKSHELVINSSRENLMSLFVERENLLLWRICVCVCVCVCVCAYEVVDSKFQVPSSKLNPGPLSSNGRASWPDATQSNVGYSVGSVRS